MVEIAKDEDEVLPIEETISLATKNAEFEQEEIDELGVQVG